MGRLCLDPALLVAAEFALSLLLNACGRPPHGQTATAMKEQSQTVVAPEPTRSEPESRQAACTMSSSTVSEYSSALADAVGQWLLQNQPRVAQLENTPWQQLPETAQARIAKNVRQAYREAAAKQAIAQGDTVSFACRREFPNCFSVAGNMESVGIFYKAIVHGELSRINDAAAALAQGSSGDADERWNRIQRVDKLLSEFRWLLPKSALLSDLQYPEGPESVAACHLAKRRARQALRVTRPCTDPLTEADRRAASALSPPNQNRVDVRDLGDLDDDGRHEFALELSAPAVTSTTLLGSDAQGCAREIVAGVNGVVNRVLESRTHGWRDLDVGVPLHRTSGAADACWVTLRAKFDGTTYRKVDVVRVEPLPTGGDANLAACQGWASALLDK